MKFVKTLLWIFCVVLLIAGCQSRKDPPSADEPPGNAVLGRDDSPRPDVEIPVSDWRSSVIVVTDAGPLSGIAEEAALNQLGKTRQVRIATGEANAGDIRYVLKTSVWKHDEGYEVNSELIDTEADTVLILFRQEASGSQVLDVTAQMMRRVAEAVTGSPADAAEPFLRTVDPRAVSLYLEAREWMAQGTHEAVNQAVQLLKRALVIQDDFTEAWQALAQNYIAVIDHGWDPNPIWVKLARQAALKIREIDPEHAHAQLILGQAALREGDFKQAEHFFRKTIEHNSSLKAAWYGLGVVFGSYGLYQPALDMYDQALRLDPFMKAASVHRGLVLSGMGRYGQAGFIFETLLRRFPNDGDLRIFLAIQQVYTHELNRALQNVETGLRNGAERVLAHTIKAMIFARQNRPEDAFALLEMEVKPQVGGNASLAAAVAAVYALIGQKGQAIQWVEKAVDLGYKEYPWLKRDPNFASLMEDPRMTVVLDQLKAAWEARMQAYLENRPA